MLGLFKKMLSKTESVTVTPFAKPVSVPNAAGANATTPTSPSRVLPAVARPLHSSIQAPPHVTPPRATSTHVQVSLAAIATALPESISHKVPASPEQFVAVSVDKILPQLAHGMVVMTVSELLECAPEAFAALSGNDDLQVTLPLGDIVKQLSPEHFTRRTQKRTEIPEEVTSVFAPGTTGVSVAKLTPIQTNTVARTNPIAGVAAKPLVISTPAPNAGTKIPMSSQALAALGATPVIGVAPVSSGPPTSVAEFKGNTSPPPLRSSGVPKPAATASVKATLGAPKVVGELAVPLGFVCNEWADEVRAQLAGVAVSETQIFVPLELLQPAMQAGKVLFSWNEVASWIRPPLAIPPTHKVGEMAVELPLKVIAPLFMAHHRAAIQKRVAVDQSIPDLFGGTYHADGQAQVTQPLPPSGAVKNDFMPAVQEARSVAPHPKPNLSGASSSSTRALKSELEAFGRADRLVPNDQVCLEQIVGTSERPFTAKEIVGNASRLPGVAGVLLAMSDGLLVTSHTPPQIKAETIAAFLPQMFGRMNQYTKELALGPLYHLALGVESGQWNVYKADAIYFAVLGKRNEVLPLNLLAQIAAELSSQSK